MNSFSRRRFLKLGTQAITGAGLALGANPLRSLAYGAETTQVATGGYRALVCIYLDGGCDGFSLMPPADMSGQQAFAQARGNLAVGSHQILDLGAGSTLGLHENAASLQPLFDQGRLAMIANVGTLIQPTSVSQYNDNSVPLPAQLFSHSDQSIQWQQLQGRKVTNTGWGSKAADYLDSYQEKDYLTSISLAGSNYWQTGASRRPFTITEDGVLRYQGMDNQSDWELPRVEAFQRVLNQQRSHVMTKAYSELQRQAILSTSELGVALEQSAGLFNDIPEENELAQNLAMVARLIEAQGTLGMQRQIFYVRMGGFDVHDDQITRQPELFTQLAEGLRYFQDKLDTLGHADSVTTFTASDFGRSLLSNGNGTDHGWGNHLMAMGGAVDGGKVYGELPLLDTQGPNSVHHGRIVPSLSATQYAATLLDWLGLDSAQVNDVLPTLANFNPSTNPQFMF